MFKKLLLILLGLALSWVGLVYWCYRDIVFTVPVAEKVVALTYDDGPSPADTPALLALLAEKDVKVTFFLKGMNVEAFPELARAQYAAGHEIGNHSWSHQPMLSFDKAAMQLEVERTSDVIEEVIGILPIYFRPPHLMQGVGLTRALKELGLASIAAGPHGTDWEVFDPELIAQAILDQVEPGNMILVHDGDGPEPNPLGQASRAGTVAATAIIIDSLREQGYRFVTVTELFSLSKNR
mgnify:CR=1 FL=1|jgi:peptidoglycan-N-acetylglucosamine deacetylase